MRVVVMSGRRLFGESVAAVLRVRSEITAVNPVTTPESLVALCELCPFDVVVIDADRDAAAMVPVCRRLRDRFAALCLVVVYDKLDPAELSALRLSGVNALVPSSHGLAALVATLLNRPTDAAKPQPAGLSGRQRDVLMLLGSGHSVPEIAALLDISPGTVENHKRRMYAKLEAKTRVHAVARAAAFGILDDGDAADGGPSRPQPARHPDGAAGHPLLVVVHGGGAAVATATQVLVEHQVPVCREFQPGASRSDHWSRWHRGPLVVLLVDPSAEDWRTAQALVRPVVVLYPIPVKRAEILDAFRRGAAAVVPPDWVDSRLVHLLSVVGQGYHVVDRMHAPGPLPEQRRNRGDSAPVPDITAREHDILRSIARGHTVRETARALGIAAKTVENAQSHLFRKLGVHNRPSALVAAYSLGLLPDLPAQLAPDTAPARPPGTRRFGRPAAS
jgi:two-component system, NarL family, nitrate/nitrite response regulator NarL